MDDGTKRNSDLSVPTLSRFYHVSPLVLGDLRLRHHSSSSISLENLAEASGSRTHRRRGDPPPAGFEDRGSHRTTCASSIFNTSSVQRACPAAEFRNENLSLEQLG